MINGEHYVEVIQYLRPDGRKRIVEAGVSKEDYDFIMENSIVISAEVLGTGEIAIYVRRIDEPEENERLQLAENTTGGDKSPNSVLARMIQAERERVTNGS